MSDAIILNLSFKKNSVSPHEEPKNSVFLLGSKLFFKKLNCFKNNLFFLKFSKLKMSLKKSELGPHKLIWIHNNKLIF